MRIGAEHRARAAERADYDAFKAARHAGGYVYNRVYRKFKDDGTEWADGNAEGV